MRILDKTLLAVTVLIGLSATTSANAANSYQEVVENHSAPLRASEKAEVRAAKPSAIVTNSFQDVVEQNSASIRTREIHEVRVEMADTTAPTSYQDVVNGNKS